MPGGQNMIPLPTNVTKHHRVTALPPHAAVSRAMMRLGTSEIRKRNTHFGGDTDAGRNIMISSRVAKM